MQKVFMNCPFCGADSKNVHLKMNTSKNGRFHYVECGICGGRTRGICLPWEFISESETDTERMNCEQSKAVIRLWNTRSGVNA